MLYRRLALVLVATLLVAGSSFAQGRATLQSEPPSTEPPTARALDLPAQPLPFKVGETLTYEVSFSRLLFSGRIGQLRMWVSKPPNDSRGELLEFKAEAVSKGFFTWLFGIKVKDQFSSIVNSQDLGLNASVKVLEEGKLRLEQKTVVNRQEGRMVYTERDLANKKAQPKVKETESPPWVQDTLSAIYLARARVVAEGEHLTIPISDGGKVYNIEVVPGKIEEVKIAAGKFQALKVEAKVFEGRLLSRKGEMFVWLSQDEQRLPLKARIKTGAGTATITLVRVQQSESQGTANPTQR